MGATETSESADETVALTLATNIDETRTLFAKVLPYIESLQKGLSDAVSLIGAGIGVITKPIARGVGEIMNLGGDIKNEFQQGRGEVNPAFQS